MAVYWASVAVFLERDCLVWLCLGTIEHFRVGFSVVLAKSFLGKEALEEQNKSWVTPLSPESMAAMLKT
eukprot:6474095-Amphidinium_carterae.1